MAINSTTTTLRVRPAATGSASGSTAPRSAASGIVRFFRDGSRQAAATTKLRRSCAAPRSAPEDRWWMMPLRPEDLVEPTGQGVEEMAAIRDALIGDPLRPVWLAVQEIVATGGNFFRCRCFHAGVVSGPLLLVAGFCQLYKVAPNLAMDIILGYIFYKLSVLAAELKRKGKANNICSRIQCVLMVMLYFRCDNPTKDSYYRFTQFIWGIVCYIYSSTVMFECIGIEHPKHLLEALIKTILTTKGGLMKVLKFLIWNIE